MALNTASLKSSLNNYLGLVVNRTDAATETLTRHGELVRKVADVIDGVGTKEDGIKTSKVLSDEGKSQAFAELSTASASKLGFMERVVSSLADDISTTKANLYLIKTPAKAGSESLQQFLFAQDIRARRLAGLNQQERNAAVLKASEADLSGDPDVQARREEFLWSVQETPGGPDITPDVMRRAVEERAQRLNPETVARLHQVEILHESLSGLRDAVAGWLQGLGGNPAVISKELGGNEPAIAPIELARKQVQV